MRLRNVFCITAIVLLAVLWGAPAVNAAIFAYDGFNTDATGSGINYEADAILSAHSYPAPGGSGQDRPRLNASGEWFEAHEPLSPGINAVPLIQNLSYPGFETGPMGLAQPYRSGGSAGPGKIMARSLSYSLPAADYEGYYVAMLVDFLDATGGGAGAGRAPSRETVVTTDGTDIIVQAPGNHGTTHTEALTSGTHLIVYQYELGVTSGNPNTDYYDRLNVWIDPDVSGGVFPATPEYQGWGIGSKLDGGGTDLPVPQMFVHGSSLSVGEEVFVDEIYITDDPQDFLIPEPSTLTLLGFFAAAFLVRGARSRFCRTAG